MKTWTILGALVTLCTLSACIESEEFSGRFLEEVPSTTIDGQDFALRLDLFQFGNEIGGIIRYYPTSLVAGTPDSPYIHDPLFCTWTEPARLRDDGSVRLLFPDWNGQESALDLRGGAADATLTGSKCLSNCDETAEYSRNQRRDMTMIRDEDRNPSTVCKEVSPFGFRLALNGSLLRDAQNERDNFQRSRTLSIGWVGDGLDDQTTDWFFRLVDVSGDDLVVTRRLPPGGANFSGEVDYVSTLSSSRISMGIPLVFEDSDVDVEEDLASTGPLLTTWEPDVENVAGTTFRAQCDKGLGEVCGDDYQFLQGVVLLYVDGAPENLPLHILTLAEPVETGGGETRRFVSGYATYIARIDRTTRRVVSLRLSGDDFISLYGRPLDETHDPLIDPERDLANLPSR